MVFIVGNDGFFVKQKYNEIENKLEIIWSDNVRDAYCFKNKTKAEKYMNNNNVVGFIWRPTKEDNNNNSYSIYTRYFEGTHIYCVEKTRKTNTSDINFLYYKKINDEIYDYDAAIKICNQKNIELLKKIAIEMGINDKEYDIDKLIIKQ